MIRKDLFMFVKYLTVGIIGLIIDISFLYVFVQFLKINVLIATPMSFLIAVVNNFLWHKYWTFHDKSKYIGKEFISFFVISLINLIITEFCMFVFVELLLIWYIVSKLITATIVLIFSYTMNRLWTFKKIKT